MHPSSSMACSVGVRGTCLQRRGKNFEHSLNGHGGLKVIASQSQCKKLTPSLTSRSSRLVDWLQHQEHYSPQLKRQFSRYSRRGANCVRAGIKREDADAGRLGRTINDHSCQSKATRGQWLPRSSAGSCEQRTSKERAQQHTLRGRQSCCQWLGEGCRIRRHSEAAVKFETFSRFKIIAHSEKDNSTAEALCS